MGRIVKFQKWVDPIGLRKEPNEFVDEQNYFEKYSEYNDEEKGTPTKPVVVTPFGLFPLNHHSNIDKAFNFWIGHTNFFLGRRAVKQIDKVDGVEVLDIFSPYRFRIGVGYCFDEDEVKNDIKKLFEDQPPQNVIHLEPTLQENILKQIEELKTQCEFWILYVLPNGSFEISRPKDINAFRQRKAKLEKARETAGGGLLFTSETQVYNILWTGLFIFVGM